MSNSGEEYCRRDRLSYRQNHQIAGAASATDRYHTPLYDAPSARHLSIHEPFTDSRRTPVSASYDPADSQDPHTLSSPYELSDKYRYDIATDHRLPPLPPSPNHYVLDSEEPFIPPPECYLSPPAPAPPDRFRPNVTSHERFLLSSGDLYMPSASSSDKYKTSTSDRMHDRCATDKYSTCSSPEKQLDRHSDRYGVAYAADPGDPYVRQDLGYHNHYRLHNSSNYYHQKPNYSSQRYIHSAAGVRPAPHNQYQTLRIQKCCSTSYHAREGPPVRDLSPGAQSRIRSSRTSSPVSMVPPAAAATIPLDFVTGSNNNGRYFSSYSSTLPRCNSYGDVQCNPSNVGTFRRTPLAHENCCFKRRTSSPSATAPYPPHSLNCSNAATATSTSTSVSSTSSQGSHQPALPQPSSTWKPIAANAASSSTNLPNNLSTAPLSSSNTSNNNSSSNVNSPSLSFSSSRSSPSLATVSTTNTTASATTSPTAISTNSGSSSAVMDNQGQPVQWPSMSSNTAEIEETASPATEIADDSLSSTNESLASPSHHTQSSSMTMPSSHHRNPPASLPVQSTFDKPMMKPPLQHQISAPVTATEVASSRRYSRSMSKKELIKNYIKKETAVFFGVHEPTEENERARWLDRTKRLAYRTYGKLKNEYQLSSACGTLQKPDVLPLASQRTDRSVTASDERDAAEPRSIESTLKRKPSVAKMTFDGVAYVVSTLGKHKRKPSSTSRQWSRSYAPSSVPPTPSSALDDEVFFDGSTASPEELSHRVDSTMNASSSPPYPTSTITVPGVDQVDSDNNAAQRTYLASSHHRMHKEKYYTWRRPKERKKEEQVQIGISRMWGRILERVLDNPDRRQYGMGFVGKVFGRSLKRSVINREPVKEQLEDLEDHRPFFTYWVTTVQILILALSIFAYGMGPVGFGLAQRSGLVLVTSLSLQQVEYSEPSNFWVGPRAADLIHMGAKFAPCMRKDKKIIKEIEKIRDRERETACCIRNDDSGCVQASQAECSQAISTWKKWTGKSGSVCGLDPKFCEAPASVAPYEWPDDITKWPICRKMNSRSSVQTSPYDQQRFQKDKMTAEHMVCEVIGHPCCIGIHGTCRITTKEYCDFVRGYFHEEASLCSQVSCLDDVCGMIPFYFPEVPDQFYRLWTSLFIHAGVLHLMVTVFIQYFLMRDLEKLTGSLRIGFIYIGSGVTGNLASAIFVPYRADVGPAGAQFGLLACLIVEVLNCWPMLKHPFQALFKLLTITFMLFLFGLLPWVDNFAHLFGFLFGFLLSYALLPFVSFGPYDRQKKIFLIWVCLLSSLFLFILLVLLFYLIPIYDCEVCQYFNCIPLTRDFCASQNINFKREEYVV